MPCGHALVVLKELEECWFESWQCGVLKAELRVALPALCVNQTREEIWCLAGVYVL